MSNIEIEIDLRPMLGSARDQGARPTCLAFAMSDAHAAARSNLTPLSSEFLHYQSLTLSGLPLDGGATLRAACRALQEAGQPVESDWPYLSIVPVGSNNLPACWAPPNGIGTLYQRIAAERAGDCQMVRRAIKGGAPIIAILVLAPSFYTPEADGEIAIKPGESTIPSAVHAVLCVGLGNIRGVPYILIRNSWGVGWGVRGHAWIAEADMQRLLVATVEIGEDPSVSHNPVAA